MMWTCAYCPAGQKVTVTANLPYKQYTPITLMCNGGYSYSSENKVYSVWTIYNTDIVRACVDSYGGDNIFYFFGIFEVKL